MVQYSISIDGDTGSDVPPCLEIVLSPPQSERVQENTKCSIGNPNRSACKKKTQLEIGCARRVWGKRKGQEQAETYKYRGRTAIVLCGMATVFL